MLLPAVNQGSTPTMIRRSSGFRAKTIPNGGWHFSSLGGGRAVIEKMTAFAHTEFDKPEKHDARQIEQEIQSGNSPLYDIHSFAVPLDNSFPPYIVDNKDRFSHLLFPVSDMYLRQTKWRRRYYSSIGRIKYILRSLLPNSLLLFLHKCRAKARTRGKSRTLTSSGSARVG